MSLSFILHPQSVLDDVREDLETLIEDHLQIRDESILLPVPPSSDITLLGGFEKVIGTVNHT